MPREEGGKTDLFLRHPRRFERFVQALQLAVDAARHVRCQAVGEVRLGGEGPEEL